MSKLAKHSLAAIIVSTGIVGASWWSVQADSYDRLKGRILLDVERNGEAWYYSPASGIVNYLGRPDDAFSIMSSYGLGISSSDLRKIKVALSQDGIDSDGDGVTDNLERALLTNHNQKDSDGDGFDDGAELKNGYDPRQGNRRVISEQATAKRLAGQILLEVENNGQAWYVDPTSLERYYLGRPSDAFSIMRRLALGVRSADIASLPSQGRPIAQSDTSHISTEHYGQIIHAKIPVGWQSREEDGVLSMGDYRDNHFKESKAFIRLQVIEDTGGSLDRFKIASKSDAINESESTERIADKEAFSQELSYPDLDSTEVTTFIRTKQGLVMAVLSAAGSENHYKDIFHDILASLE